MTELLLLQALNLKGRLTPAMAGIFGTNAWSTVTQFGETGLADVGDAGARLTPVGRGLLQALIVAERATTDRSTLSTLYAEFDQHNIAVKQTITSWQVRADGTANDHHDPDYDAEVIERLAACHHDAVPMLERVVSAAPRLAHYPGRFDIALSRARAGDARAVAYPLDDSYHQIWFELHQDLLGLLGLTRAAEAMAGRAE